jgi:flagellar hook-associated protein 3 FlgL
MSLERVTNAALSRTILSANQETLARVALLQEQLATGKRLNRPSDDALAARQSLRLRVDSLKFDKYDDNIERTLAFVNSADSALSAMGASFDEAKRLATDGANATGDANSRRALAEAVDAQLRQMVDLANTQYDSRYLFAGTATVGRPPFELQATQVAYHGNLDDFSVQINSSSVEPINRNGQALFKAGSDVFKPLIELRDALRANDPRAVRDLIGDIDAAHVQVNQALGAVGGQTRRLEVARTQIEELQTSIKGLISRAEDADLPETISSLQLAQNALDAGLQSGAMILKRTLLDYL